MGIKNMLRVARGNEKVFLGLYEEIEAKIKKLKNNEEVFDDEIDIFCPMIMTGAFACEIYLKILLTKQNISYERKHSLEDLYNLLNDKSKDDIKTAFLEEGFDENFDKGLEEISNAFVKWRYFYELNPRNGFEVISVRFLKLFLYILEKYYEYLEESSRQV